VLVFIGGSVVLECHVVESGSKVVVCLGSVAVVISEGSVVVCLGSVAVVISEGSDVVCLGSVTVVITEGSLVVIKSCLHSFAEDIKFL
jgi:acyl-coenzyme A thioesterase PaaI-like protein